MPLAGRMKLKHFLLLVGGVVGVSVFAATTFGVGMFGTTVSDSRATAPTPRPVQAVPMPTPVAEPTTAPAPEPAADGLRDVDRVVFGYEGKNLGSGKLKDVTKGRPFKVNVYQDDGHTTANRAKVDLDRDDKWDEKWTFDAEGVQRKVAPADDENYSETYRFSGGDWVPEG